MRKFVLISLIGVLACGTATHAPSSPDFQSNGCPDAAPVSLAIQVIDQTETPIRGAAVQLTGRKWSSGSEIRQVTNEAGRVTLACVPAGPGYLVTVSKEGYFLAERRFDAVVGERSIIDVKLRTTGA